ncbi:hypothetical protein [Streptomyces sp. RKAG293]|uniref:hypothetical protein n=1 Tax=Streptomyces sp. RKAG293 TaxID=2893403 RepID=UPI002033DBCB|nr:hypothetical protein [Streptomyces sp. RKAG293]MCM2424144.1 hypothetical protein [Streptomyces sp. RKAG293]
MAHMAGTRGEIDTESSAVARLEYKGRTIETRPVAEDQGEEYPRVAFAINGEWDVDGRPQYGMPGQSAESVVSDAKRLITQVDGTFSPYVRAYWYQPGTVEPCPRTKGAAYGQHIKPVGAVCPELRCVKEARVKARRAARATGITASSLSNLLARGGFTRAELRSDGTARSEGFSAEGEDHNRRVVILWRGAGPADSLAGELPRIAEHLQGKGFRVEVSVSGRYLVVFARGAGGTGEREYTPGGAGVVVEQVASVPAPNAQGWQVQLARRELAARTDMVDIEADDDGALDGFQVLADGQGVMVLRVQRGADPRKGTAARERWDAALDQLEAALAEAGFTHLSRNRVRVSARAPRPQAAPTIARVQAVGRPDEFTERVRFAAAATDQESEHPYDPRQVGGDVILHANFAGATLYVVDAAGTHVGRGYRDRASATEALADWYGLPLPVQINHEPSRRDWT